jgi:hypothetical protein
MEGKFDMKPFSEIDINDTFFDSLKNDYEEFTEWFIRKSKEGRKALVFNDEYGLGAFVAFKTENEPLVMNKRTLPATNRMKITTLCLSERYRGQRLGEGAIGLMLWEWQKLKLEEIYVTVFKKHDDLIQQLERFGFQLVGFNQRGECIYLRSRKHIDYLDPYKSFPFINPSFSKGGYLIVNDIYHDTLFPYSELKHTLQTQLEIAAANGVSKVYIGNQWQRPHYNIGEPVFIYRRYTEAVGTPRYKSCVTSYCVVTGVSVAKQNGKALMSYEQLCNAIGNKSVFDRAELHEKYRSDKNLIVIQLLYYGFFGSGNNINMDWLDNNGLWSPAGSDIYPANIQLSPQQCRIILEAGGVDINSVFLE